uniref:Uncharacterized protein n=1 Tax=Chlamydomonas euryale TaxID=1486919 RepID=A0A7R9VI40_9CHLO|mmetsp:Transcript_36020/g.106495  ORF Transcript_36020/g.106495 Transcript_36020/m.106495 type:complete len:215 (+) Transcript_36020:332-976(+)
MAVCSELLLGDEDEDGAGVGGGSAEWGSRQRRRAVGTTMAAQALAAAPSRAATQELLARVVDSELLARVVDSQDDAVVNSEDDAGADCGGSTLGAVVGRCRRGRGSTPHNPHIPHIKDLDGSLPAATQPLQTELRSRGPELRGSGRGSNSVRLRRCQRELQPGQQRTKGSLCIFRVACAAGPLSRSCLCAARALVLWYGTRYEPTHHHCGQNTL